jgi:hypothetical protein
LNLKVKTWFQNLLSKCNLHRYRVVPEVEAGAWGSAWLVTMTFYLPMLKRTCMLHKATALERVFYSNFSALVVLCLVGVFYYTTQVGLYKLNIQLTHSLTAPGFNP